MPKSTGGRVGLGLGAAAGVYGVNNVRKYRKQDLMNNGKGPYPNGYTSPGITGPSLQKHYDWQKEGGATDAQARRFISTIRPGEDLSGLY